MNAPLHETPQQAARRLAQVAVRGEFTSEALHIYRDAGGQPVYYRWRVRKLNGEKVIRPMRESVGSFVAGEPQAPTTGKRSEEHTSELQSPC